MSSIRSGRKVLVNVRQCCPGVAAETHAIVRHTPHLANVHMSGPRPQRPSIPNAERRASHWQRRRSTTGADRIVACSEI